MPELENQRVDVEKVARGASLVFVATFLGLGLKLPIRGPSRQTSGATAIWILFRSAWYFQFSECYFALGSG
jgi:hypothetical protein